LIFASHGPQEDAMKIVLETDESIRLEGIPGPLTVEADSAEHEYSPFQMLASGLATCTFAVLNSWAQQAKLAVDDMKIRVSWEFVDKPHRIGTMRVGVEWPGLPEERRAAAERVAALCAVHQTLSHPPEIAVEIAP
jgi:uncharacterized OsmC-like protein